MHYSLQQLVMLNIKLLILNPLQNKLYPITTTGLINSVRFIDFMRLLLSMNCISINRNLNIILLDFENNRTLSYG